MGEGVDNPGFWIRPLKMISFLAGVIVGMVALYAYTYVSYQIHRVDHMEQYLNYLNQTIQPSSSSYHPSHIVQPDFQRARTYAL